MEERIAVVLDFRMCRYVPELYWEMRTKMEWADFFGENLDALWDILTAMPYKGDDFTIIRPMRFENIPHGQNEMFTEYVDKICSIFQEAQTEYGDITVTVRYIDDKNEDLADHLI